MEPVKPTKTVFTVSQFVDWSRNRTLDLNPIFQRRQVWKPSAKSQLIDSVYRGYPIPIILLRQVQDYRDLSLKMEVVDGQQRLRTLISFISPDSLRDYDEEKDGFHVRKIHNPVLAGKDFNRLSRDDKADLLSYELSTHVLPSTTSDELVHRIFARLNSTGLPLNSQELRNSEFHGAFKSVVYEIGFKYYDTWTKWRVFTPDKMARMEEAEAVSEYIIAMYKGIVAKSQPSIRQFYKTYDDEFNDAPEVERRFVSIMGAIDRAFGEHISRSAFSRPTLFYSLFTALYSHMFGFGSQLVERSARDLPKDLPAALSEADIAIRGKKLTDEEQDAMDRATGDKARRDRRYKFLVGALHLEPLA